MDRQALSSIAHAHHPIAAPVSEVNVNRLLRRAACRADARILDLGCGSAAWTLHALTLYPSARADAVDLSAISLARAAVLAENRGVADRLALHESDAVSYPVAEGYDLAMCVGSTHAYGGFAAALEGAGKHVSPYGLLLIGEGFWELPPTDAALRALDAAPGDFADLAGTVDLAEKAGWTPIFAHVSEAGEWDDYEWSWVGSLTRWALDTPGDPNAVQALALAREHREQWLRGYRHVLGFVCLLLQHTR